MGQTRVDLLHLLEDLRDAYPGALEETILTEIVANALDSGAAAVHITGDAVLATLTIVDDGSGMSRRELARYHDIAASSKTRGQGIGFAGVGIKLSLLLCEDVLMETRRGGSHVATVWQLATRHRAPWRWAPPPGLVARRGTAVRLHLANPLSPLLDAGFLESVIQRHFQPLLDSTFDQVLASQYPNGVDVTVNGRILPRVAAVPGAAPLALRIGRRRKPSAVGYLVRESEPLPEDRRGVAVSTLAKVIKRGWDWLGLSPAIAERVAGLIEAPGLAGCLTLNKADFIRTGSRGMTYLAYRKAIQEAVSAQLAVWGDLAAPADEARRRRARPLERDLQTVLVDLARDFPLLSSLVEPRAGGQRRLPFGGRVADLVSEKITLWSPAGDGREEPAGSEPEIETEVPAADAGVVRQSPEEPERLNEARVLMPPETHRGRKRPARYGLSIQFEHRPEDPKLGRIIESTVWVNEAHPAYRRAAATRAEGYHLALTVAMALAPLVVEPARVHDFVTVFLARWGEAIEGKRWRRGRAH